MLEELQQIDTSAIEELCKIKEEQEILQARLGAMEEQREKVSDAVFDRVHRDYESRHEDLEQQARPLKEQARAEYAKLRDLHEQCEESLQAANLDKEELEFRHDLGEYPDDDFAAQLTECKQRLKEREAELTEAEALKERFIAAFHSPEELEAPVAEEPPEVEEPPPADETPAEQPQLPPVEPSSAMDVEATEAGVRFEAPAEGTTELPRAEAADEEPEGATMVLRGARLLGTFEDGRTQEYMLGVEPTSLGRAPDNAIQVVGETISRYHAQIVMDDQGFVVRDLGSENGTFIGGQQITEQRVGNGDLIQIGAATFEFRDD